MKHMMASRRKLSETNVCLFMVPPTKHQRGSAGFLCNPLPGDVPIERGKGLAEYGLSLVAPSDPC